MGLRRRWTGAAALLAVLVTLLSACSGDDTAEGGATDVETAGPVGDGADDGAAPGGNEEAEDDGGANPISVGAPLGRKVIQRAELTLEVDDPAAAMDEITALTERAGGFVAGVDLQRTGREDELHGHLTLRIPTGELSDALQQLRRLAVRVPAQHLGTEDVTEEYSDITAQLRNLRALETELVALLEEVRGRTDSADEVLSVFERIREVRSEIERLEGRQQVLDDLVELATVEVELRPTESAIAVTDDGWRPGDTLRAALRTTVGALQAFADAAIWVAVTVLPLALLIALPAAAVAFGLRRRRRVGDGAAPSA